MPGRMDHEQLAQRVEQLAHDIENHASASAAAEALRDVALAGADIAQAVDILVRAIDEATQIPVLEPAADALTSHLLRTGQADRLWDLADRLHWGSYLAAALRRAAARGKNIDIIVPRLCEPPARQAKQVDPLPVLNAYIGRDAKRLRAVSEALAENNRPLLIRLFRDHLLPRSGLDLSGALPTLVGLLEAGDPAVVRETTWVTYLAAEAGLDLARLFSALAGRLSSPDPETRTRAAYSLAYAHLRQGDWPAFDAVQRHADGRVRGEAVHALCVALHAERAESGEILARLSTALLDRDAAVRKMASDCLAKAHQDARPITPPPAVIDALLSGLRDPVLAGGLAHYLSLVILATPDAAQRWQSAIVAASESSADPAVIRLRQLCSAGDAPPCPLCLRLPRHAIWNYERDEPPGLSELESDGAYWRCPNCRSVYRRSYESEWEDMSFSETWTLDRLSPTAARGVLAGDALAWLEQNFDRLLRDAGRQLDHPLRRAREDAAWVLAEHFLAARDFEELGRILTHADETVRSVAAACLDAQHLTHAGLVVPPSLRAALLADSSASVRRSAATIEARQAWRQSTPQPVAAMLRAGDSVVIVAAIGELRRAGDDGSALLPFVADLVALAGHPDAEVRRAVGWALGGVGKTPDQERTLVATCQRMLSARAVERRNEGADRLRALAAGGVDIAAALPALAPMLVKPKTAWHANAAVKAAIGQGADAGPVLDAIIEGLGRTGMDRQVDFAETLQVAAQAGQDIRRALPTIVRRMASGNETLQGTLVRLVHGQHAKGVAVDVLADELEAALPKLEPYLREVLTPILMAVWLRRSEWPRISALLRRRLSGTECCACEALAAACRDGVDIAPVVADLAGLFASRNA